MIINQQRVMYFFQKGRLVTSSQIQRTESLSILIVTVTATETRQSSKVWERDHGNGRSVKKSNRKGPGRHNNLYGVMGAFILCGGYIESGISFF